ncbi:hypothetical protein EZV62_026247 [Acer yangbiense]|uniref:Pyridoxal phosphate homeostasis protein n=1 Tax=Acer yangbiense TaxID=1000413 RepID=A0A5C7GQU2_9ROSI|nr:hypothetical protein EZV62_026247 [Acer yangbiense]
MKMTRKVNNSTSLESTDTGVATANLRPWKGQTLLSHHKHRLIRSAHGILNIIGWGTLLPVGAIIARYLRKFPLELYNEWYPLHVLCQSSGYLLGTLGWGIGLWLGNSSKQYTLKTHRILGIFVFTFSTVQMLAVFVYPRIRDEFRRCWEIYHQIMGYALIALIIANIFQGATHQNHAEKWKWVYVGVLAILALIALALEKEEKKKQKTMAASSAVTDGVAAAALRSVIQRVHQAAERSGRASDRIRIVAVSKTKPVSLIRQVYDAGHRSFGENYVQEIVEKAPQLPEDIEWSFIGNLQSNKVKPLLAGVPNLATVESVDDKKTRVKCIANDILKSDIADRLDRMVASIGRKPLKIYVQVNTSGEESKYGVEPSGCVELAKYVSQDCPNLEFCGLMTIGMPDYTSTPENFKTLAKCRSEVCEALGIPEEQCELSMGMSGDFELAIEMGSTNVRIGSTIFGAREYPKKN